MNLPSLVRLVIWFLPIPFMTFYLVKTKRLNYYSRFVFYFIVVNVFALFFVKPNFGFYFWMIQYHLMGIGLIFLVYRKKLDFPQALSLAFNTVYFNGLFWEIPIHIYTFFVRGYIDQAFPLHLIQVFPFLFILNVTDIKWDRETLVLFTLSLTVSSLLLLFLIRLDVNIWQVYNEPSHIRALTETVWMMNRMISLTCLTAIIYRGIKDEAV